MPSDVLITPASSKIDFTDGANATKTLKITGTSLNIDTSFAIGATTANNTLSVLGSASIGSAFNVAAPTNGLIVQGNVGIGTTSPSNRLDSAINVASSNHLGDANVYALAIKNYDATAGNAVGMTFGHGGYNYTNFVASIRTGTGANPKGDLVFGGRPADGSAFTENMRLQAGGNVGIGATNPIGKLQLGADYANDGYGGYDIYVKSTTAGTLSSYDPRVQNTSVFSLLITDSSSTTTGPDKIGLVLHNNNATAGAFSPMLLFTKKESGSTPYKATMAGIYARSPLGTGNADSWIDGELIFATAGAASEGIKQRMVIDKEGNVGVGVTSPRALLDLAKANNVGQVFLLGETGANIRVGFGLNPSNAGMRIFSLNHITDGLIEFGGISSSDGSTWTRNHRLGLAGANSFFNEQGGNVGIGTVTPSAKLSTGATSGMKLLVYDNSSTGVYTGLGQDLAAGNSTDLFAHSVSNLGFITFGKIGTNGSTYTEWGRFNPSGNLGIGTTNPTNKLHVYSNDNELVFIRGTTAGAWMNIQSSTSNLWSIGADGVNGFSVYNRNSNNYALIVKNDGNLGIGNITTASNKLHVNGSASIGSNYNTAAPTNGLIVEGNVGIGVSTLNAGAKLHVVGNADIGDSTADTGIIVRHGSGSAQYGRIRFYSASTNIHTIHSFPTAWNGGTFLNASAGAMNLQGTNGITFGSWNSIDVAFAQGGNNYFKGNVGIGITVPSATLHVNSTTSGATLLRADGTNGALFSVIDDLSDSLMSVNNSAGLPVLEVFADDRVVMGQYGVNDFVLRSNKIGVGTNNPNDQLTFAQVDDDAIQIRRRTVSQGGPATGTGISWTWTSATTDTETWAAVRAIFPGNSDSHLTFSTRNTSSVFGERMRIQNDGNVGINTASPAYKLDVYESSSADVARFYNNSASCNFYIGSTNNTTATALVLYTSNGNGQIFKNRSSTAWGGADSFNIYSSNGAIAFHPAGTTNAVYFATNGNVGINNTNPAYKLDVNGTSAFRDTVNIGPTIGTITWGNFGGGTGFGVRAESGRALSFGAGGNFDHLVINTAGNVGIGTASPGASLEIYATPATSTTLRQMLIINTDFASASGTGFGGSIVFRGRTAGNLLRDNAQITAYNEDIGDNGYALGFFTRPNDTLGMVQRMTIARGGNVGIGTVSPAYKLQVDGTFNATGTSTLAAVSITGTITTSATEAMRVNNNNGYISIYNSAGSTRTGYIQGLTGSSLVFAAENSAILQFNVGGSERVRIDTNGNVGIGTTVPVAYAGFTSLTIGNTSSIGLIKLRSAYSSGNGAEIYQSGSGHLFFNINSSLTSMYLKVDGNVGIGTLNPLSKLAVDGVTSVGPSSKLSLIGLDINSGATPTYVKIVTTIPVASPSADFTVNIKGFVYGAVRNADISISWHYYLSTFYNPIAKSSGGWAPTIRLSAEGGFVAIVLSSPGYWPKFYVESMYSSAYSNQYSSGWSWVDADATGSPIVNVPYASNFGNNFVMLTDGNVGVGTASPATKLHVVGSSILANATSINPDSYLGSVVAGNVADGSGWGVTGGIAGNGNANGRTWAMGSSGNFFYMGFQNGSTGGSLQTFLQVSGPNRDLYLVPTSGNVGIGTTAPAALLQINSGTPTSATRGIQFGDDTGTRLYRSASGIITCSGTIAAAFSGNLTGNATNVTGTVALANGGSGQNSAQAAMNAFAGAVTSGSYLRGNGTNVVMSTIQVADVPTLNQSTTGNAATASLATTSDRLTSRDNRTISSNEDDAFRLRFGFTSWANNDSSPYADYLHLRSYSDATGGNDNLVMFRKDAIGMRIYQAGFGTSVAYSSFKDVAFTDQSFFIGTTSVAINRASAALTLNGVNISGTAANVTGTVAIANGGTGTTTAQLAINALAGAVTNAQYLRGNGTNVVMSAIQAADVPTLNQNTTGSSTFVASLGVLNYDNDRTTKRAGLSHYTGYSTGTNRPTTYDYTLQVTNGTSGWEISMDWIATTGPAIYARSLRDCCQNWSSWVRILDSANYSFAANMNQNVRTTDGVTFAGITGNGQLNINHSTPTAVARLWSGGSTVWSLGVGDASGSYFNISADFGSFTINKTNGYVGIGTTSQTTRLQLGSGTPTASADGIQFGGDTSARLYRSSSGVVSASNSFSALGGFVYASNYLQTGGNLIYPASFSATQRLEVGNTAQNAWITGISIAPGGNVVVAGTLTESSSIRYKENVKTIIAPILPKLNEIRPVTYNKKDNPNNIEYGIIAEELNDLFPELVNKNDNGEVESVNYSRLTVLLIKAVKELKQEIEILKNK